MRKKVFNNIEEVKSEREANTPFIFNMVSALDALDKTAPKVNNSSVTGLSKFLLDIFNERPNTDIAVNQLVSAITTGGMKVTNKQVADRCWLLAKQGKLSKGSSKGTYRLVKE